MTPSQGRPIVRLTPQPKNVEWYSPDMQLGLLHIRVEIAVQSLCIDDVVDVWDIIVTALSPGDLAFTLSLVQLGAETGEIVFSDPAMDPQPAGSSEGYFIGDGAMHLRVGRQI